MFKIPEAMQKYWAEQGKPKATVQDIARIETAIQAPLARPYVEFVTQFGFVVFNDVPGMRRFFDYTASFPDRQEIREGDIAFLFNPEKLIRAYGIATTARSEDDEERPFFPPNYLPVGNDLGQGLILLELGPQSGQVWYWPEREWAWGREDNTWLGFVAADFYGFVNGLRAEAS
jgi:hypothetical protein